MDYASTALDTTRTIREEGGRITLTRQGEPSYDTETSTNAADIRVHEGHAVRTEFATNQIDGTSIMSGDERFLIAVHDINDQPMPRPVEGHTVTFVGEKLRVVKSKPVAPAGIPVLWDTQARR